MKHTILSTVLLLGLSPLAVSAAGDETAGKTKAFTCMGCHGIPNYTNVYPSYRVPKIGGQNAEYLVSALQSYKSGQRSHETMQAQAGSLSDQDMEDLAAYFAGMSNE